MAGNMNVRANVASQANQTGNLGNVGNKAGDGKTISTFNEVTVAKPAVAVATATETVGPSFGLPGAQADAGDVVLAQAALEVKVGETTYNFEGLNESKEVSVTAVLENAKNEAEADAGLKTLGFSPTEIVAAK